MLINLVRAADILADVKDLNMAMNLMASEIEPAEAQGAIATVSRIIADRLTVISDIINAELALRRDSVGGAHG